MKITGVGGCPYEDREGEILNIDVNLDEGEILYEGGTISIEMMDDSFLEREIKIINPKWAGDYGVISEKAKQWKQSGKTLREAKGPGHYSIVVTDVPYEDTVIMGGDPTPNVTIEEMNFFAMQAETEKELADVYAMASNKAWWVEDDIYDYEEGTPEHKEACRITDEWFAIAELIRNRIFEILKSEGVEVTNRGYIEILKPFMARNGYRDGRGWWVQNDD